MPYKFQPKAVVISGLSAWPDDYNPAELIELDLPYGARWGYAVVRFPKAFASNSTPAAGDSCTIRISGTIILRGVVTELPQNINAGADGSFCYVADVRWWWSRRKIGQYGIGSEDETAGGFPIVGYQVIFNPGGVANRSEEAVSPNLYTFSSTSTAQKWLRKDVLHFLVAWYAPSLTIGTLSTAWDDPIENFIAYGKSTLDAISELCADTGVTWAIGYDESENVSFLEITENPATTVTAKLENPHAGKKVDDASELSIREYSAITRITDSADIVEVQSGKKLIEATLTNYEDEDACQMLTLFDPKMTGFCAALIPDVTKYETFHLGKNLPAGSRPKSFVRELVSRLKEDRTAYYPGWTEEASETEGDYAELLAGKGFPVHAELCVWAEDGENPTAMHLLKSGIRIIPEQALILVENTIEAHDGWWRDFYSFPEDLRLRITVVTEIEESLVIRSTDPATWHIADNYKLVETIVRTDIRPKYRYQTYLPTFDVDDPNLYYAEAETDLEAYINASTLLARIGTPYLHAVRDAETDLTIRFLDIPTVAVGSKLAISPAVLGLTGNEIIAHIRYNCAESDYVEVRVTNNYARLIAGDV